MVTTPDDALALVAAICAFPQNSTYLEDTIEWVWRTGITQAVADHDTPALFAWLVDGFSYQGISDQIADAYIAAHGGADWGSIKSALRRPKSRCPKLKNFEAYRGCRYRKTIQTCGNLDALPSCPVATLPLRKGSLNEQAFSLFFFIRDRCRGDLVAFIDDVLRSTADEPDPGNTGREALLAAFGAVKGVSRKLLSMMLSALLIGAGQNRPNWMQVGSSMVAIDSLVHNHLHRTGILAAYDANHPYGQRCYNKNGCEAIVRDLANRFDARAINPVYPKSFPRLVQHAIWRFCATRELNICNGRNIDDDVSCELDWCPLRRGCSRIPLRKPREELTGSAKGRGRSHHRVFDPYRQGELDGLCGIYAIINAIRLVIGRSSHLTPEEWQKLYAVLIRAVDETVGAATAAVGGIEPKPLFELLKVAVRHMADEHDLKIKVRHVLKRGDRPPFEKLAGLLKRRLERSDTAILISLNGHLDHWTVLRRVNHTTLTLFDSSGFARIALANCRTSYQRSTTKLEHIVRPRALFQISLVP
jgi:hypothetical protein